MNNNKVNPKTASKPLHGVLVVSIEQALAAPLCSCRMADAGARVIKIERETGDFARGYDAVVNGESAYFVWANRGKESVVLDIKSTDGQNVLHNMLARADVFIQNLAPGAAARLGFASESLRLRYPQLITCDISGYGDEGEYKDMKAYDLLIQAESGLVAVSGGPESYGRIGVSVCDIAAAMNALSGILMALVKRESTGQGSSVKVSLFDSAVDWMSVPILHQKYAGRGPDRMGLKHPSIAPYGSFKTADGKIIVIAIQSNREWRCFCNNVLQQPDLADDERFHSNNRRVVNTDKLDSLIGNGFSQYSSKELRQLLQDNAIAFASVNQTEDLSHHPQLRQVEVNTSAGVAQIIASPVIFDNLRDNYGPVPALGEHTEKLMAEFSTPDADS